MKAAKLHWVETFYLGITLISCKEANFNDNSGSNELPGASFHKPRTTTQEQYDSGISASTDTIKYEPLSPNEFSPTLAQVLTPQIFSQSNPIIYLLDEILKLRFGETIMLDDMVLSYLKFNKLPSYYVPYAELMLPILHCTPDLRNLRRAIFDIINFTDSHSASFTLPDKLARPELSAVFAPDVFSDPNPPSVIFNKTMDLEENYIPHLILELKNIFWYRLLPSAYANYANALASFLQNWKEHRILREYNSKMKNASTVSTK